MFDRIGFVIGEAFVALRRNFAMTFAAVTTGAVALLLLGILAFGYKVADDYSRTVPAMFDMRVFLRDGTGFPEIRATADEIRHIKGVSEVSWIPRAKAWAKLQKEQPEFTQGIENPFPDQFKVVLSDLHGGERIATQIQALPMVREEGVNYLREEQRVALAALQTFRLLGPALVALLLVATGILIYNTIRLTVISRRVEIRIMQLVGASRFVVRFPFLIEGVAQGVAAGGCAGLLLLLADRVVASQLAQQNIQFAAFPTTQAICLMIAAGAGYGLLCSFVAVRVPLRYR